MFTATRTTAHTLGALLALAAFTATGFAGPLAPPAGAIQSTGKTLTEVEPRTAINATNTPGNTSTVYRITQPGSYYLTGNITVPSGKNGLEIAASDVTIDMNGFTMTGVTGSSYGIFMYSTPERQHIHIMNGTIAGMGLDGIILNSYTPTKPQQHSIEHMNVRDCGGFGISINDGQLTECQVSGNTNSGITAIQNYDTIVSRCTSSNNGGEGIRITLGSIHNSSATGNTAVGLMCSTGTISDCSSSENNVGYRGDTVNITGCTAYENTTGGIQVGGGAMVKNNTINAPTVVLASIGIWVYNVSGTRIEGNNITRYSTGIKASSANNFIVSNTFDACTTAIDAVANNRIGAILTGTGSAALVGNAGGGLGVTDPYANIRY